MMLTVMGFFFFVWMLWVVLEWISPMEEPDDENPNRSGFFRLSGVCMLIKLACYGVDFSRRPWPAPPSAATSRWEFFLSWVILWSTYIANAMLVLACIHGCKSFWETIFGDRPAFNGPDTVLFLATVLGVFGTYESLESNGMSEAEQAMLARARRHTRSAWYDEETLGTRSKTRCRTTSGTMWTSACPKYGRMRRSPNQASSPRHSARPGKEREARREAERLAQKKRDRQEAKGAKGTRGARCRQRPFARLWRGQVYPPDAPYEERERPLHLTREQVLEARYTRALASAEIARRRWKSLRTSTRRGWHCWMKKRQRSKGGY